MSERKFRTHYDNLKVSQDAPFEVIKAAYRSLIQKHHPDRNGDDPESHRILSIINQSYEVLSDPESRKKHDEWIAKKLKEQQPKRKAVRSKVSTTRESSTSDFDFRSSTPDYPTVFFNVYLKKYNVKKSDLMNAIWNGKLRTVKVGSNTFVEDKPISASSDLSSKLTSLLLFGFIIGVIALFVMSSNNRPVQVNSNNYNFSDNGLNKQPLPPSGVLSVYTNAPLVAPFTVFASPSESHFIKLKDSTTGKDVITLFVRAGEHVRTMVPLGTYTHVYASGRFWFGEDMMFGNRTKLAKSLKTFNFYKMQDGRIMGAIIRLQGQIDGNLKSKNINRSEFR